MRKVGEWGNKDLWVYGVWGGDWGLLLLCYGYMWGIRRLKEGEGMFFVVDCE